MEDFRKGSDSVEVVGGGFFDELIFLSDDDHFSVFVEGILEGAHGHFSADEEGVDGAGEVNRIADGDNGQFCGKCLG
jgi:hypothetical protein